MRAGLENSEIEGLSLAYTSGEEYRSGSEIGIQNVRFPLDVKIKYRAWNQLHTAQYDVVFEFTIIELGTWEVTITN